MKDGIQIRDLQSTYFSEYIDSYRIYRFNQPTSLQLNPEGSIEIVFQLNGDFYQRSLAGVIAEKRPKSFIGGLHSSSFEIQNPLSGSELLSVRFKPEGAKQFITEDLSVLKNSLIDLMDIMPNVGKLNLQCKPDEVLVKELDSSLAKSFRDEKPGALDMAIAYIQQSAGFISIADICDNLKLSRSYLRRIFNQGVGMSPKEYAKILRVSCATNRMQNSDYNSLTELAYELGYFDQAHFIKDFKSVTTQSPGRYAKQLV